MWYVLEAEPGASLLTGFSRPIAPAEYERRVADNTLTDVLNRQAIASGDVFYLPAGRVHSIGKGPSSSRSSKVRTSPTGSTISTGGMQRAIPGVAYRIGTRSDRFRIFRKQPHNVRSGEQSGSPACHHALLYYVAIYLTARTRCGGRQRTLSWQ